MTRDQRQLIGALFLHTTLGTLLSIAGIIGSFFLIKYRERAGDLIGSAAWMDKIGGVYNVIILCAVILFFWSIAALTGTLDIFFAPIRRIVPGLTVRQEEQFQP